VTDERGGSTGKADAFPVSIPLCTIALALVGGAVGVVATPAEPLRDVSWVAVATFFATLTVAGSLRVEYRYRGGRLLHGREEANSFDLFEAILLPLVFALPGLGAVVVAMAAKSLSERLARVSPVVACFNVAQWMCATAVGSLVFVSLRDGRSSSVHNVPALLVAMLSVMVVNYLAFVVVLSLNRRQSFLRVLASTAPGVVPFGVASTVNLAFGVLFLAAYAWTPVATPLFLVPLGLLHWAGRAYATVRADGVRLHGMQRATHALGMPMDPRQATPRFLAEVRKCFEHEAADLIVVAGRERVVHRSRGGEPEYFTFHEPMGTETLATALLALEGAMRVRPGESDAAMVELLLADGWRNCLAAPVRSGGQTIGALVAYDRTGLEGFEEGELAVLEALAGELGGALQKGELLEAIMEERTKLSEIFSNTSDGIATIDPDGTVASWNPGFERITGYAAADVVGTKGLARLRPRDADGREVRVDRWASDAGPLPAVLEVLTPDGRPCWISCAYARVPAAGSRYRRLILTSRDITKEFELRRAERALRDSEARFRALVQNSSHMVIVLDVGGTITYASPAFSRMLGYRGGARIGQNLFDLVHPDDVKQARTRFSDHLGQHEPNQTFGFRILAAGGRWRHIETLANNLLDDPSVGGVVFNCRDVTERKRAEALLAGQAHVLDLIARDAALPQTLTSLAQVIETEAEGARCAILLLDEDRARLGVAAAPNLRADSLAEADGLVVGPQSGASGAAVHRQAAVIVPDVTTHANWARTREAAKAMGIRAAWAVPIMASDAVRVLGTLTLYHETPRSPEPGDWQLLELAAHLADIAIERTQAQARLAYQAAHDALTGLPNRLCFLDRASMALARTQRTRASVAVLFLDLDRFKFINDSLGHAAGNRLLIALTQRLQQVVRPGDTVARFGGDEFTILCENIADEAHALAIAERVAEAVAQPFLLDEAEVFVTMSVGIALGSGPHFRPEALMENADAAMYRAKARGGNRREVFDQAMRARARRRLAMHSSMYRAVERGEFRVFYQPNVSLDSGELEGVEALVRWEHPARGLLEPKEFIGLAEETGLIVPIGTYVLREACLQAERWRTAGPGGRPLNMSINLSARQFARPKLAGLVADILAETGADPASIYLEITESVLMEDAESTNAALAELKALGVSLSIDDFGTGYSSLTYLRRFPVDKVKVDRVFVDGLLGDPEDAAIVTAVVNLAHNLDLRAVAEGVETAEQVARLRDLGCDIGQGYYFGQPQPPEAMASRLGLTPA
jgi:diguanylate cyclase (GGDEF)-like protein/PAS domain S-box-containing protein